jgi:hypothetical protein
MDAVMVDLPACFKVMETYDLCSRSSYNACSNPDHWRTRGEGAC